MASANYEINAQQNSTFDFHVEYYGTTGAAVDLSGYTSRFHVRASNTNSKLYLEISTSGVTHGGSTGEFSSGAGVAGSGGISLNAGETGGSFTGGIRITADATSMGYLPDGIWKYSLDITKGVTTDELLSGNIVVIPKATR